MSARERALKFVHDETQFHLGFLPTEQSNPLTANLDKEFEKSKAGGVRCLQRVDRNVAAMARRVFDSSEFERLVETGLKVIRQGGRVVCSGCGATGRLSILLECMWREAAADSGYADSVASIMTGGDYALVRSVEFFEDYPKFGQQQVREMKMTERDMLVAITEGGETSSVLGTVDECLNLGAAVFLMFNNPADLLAKHLERSRRAIEDPRVCVLDLSCGPMALAGSTRMQATTSEQLVAGSALETIFCRLSGKPTINYAAEFEKLLDGLEQPETVNAIAGYIDFEAETYQRHGKITYYANDFMLDIFTDTTERSPTFMLPPFCKTDDHASPQSWAFVKNPLYPTPDTWRNLMRRELRCLEWTPEDYQRLGAALEIKKSPPLIRREELLKFAVGNEPSPKRCNSENDAAVLIRCGRTAPELAPAFAAQTTCYPIRRELVIGSSGGDYNLPLNLPESPLRIMEHMAVKLVLNTVSTGTMVCLGRVTGNWMSWVDVTNKKLLDRGIRLLTEIGKIDYEKAAIMLFESIDELSGLSGEKPSAVQHALAKIR